MLNKYDIDLIKETRREITEHRESDITFIGEKRTGEHPITGEPITSEIPEETVAVVYEITSAFKFDRELSEGVDVQNGDLWIDVDLRDMAGFSPDEVKSVKYEGVTYTVMSSDSVGLGEDNRVQIIGRRTS
ncbi:hypothetical protein [Virgibacillus pantothenticus]|uniref:hypothetical protein n=1 Tax=Virgibacillus pantothenticus TaxID=1473 RepID=UPI0009877C46|nr:hypothetical protein [Virgibacillus pantothenticus]